MENFLSIFIQPFLICFAMVVILGYFGIHVLKREVIFIDISLAQIAAVGAITAHVLFGIHDDSFFSYLFAFIFIVAAAFFYAFIRNRVSQISLEAVIGMTYAIAAAAALFLVGVAPGGHIHIQHMLAGSILWASWKDVLSSLTVFLIVGFFFFLCRRNFDRISDDYDKAAQTGAKVFWWDFLFYSLLGIVITLSVKIGGVVVVFAFLIIPTTISAVFSAKEVVRLILAWAAGTAAIIAGFFFADSLDFSVGPSVALFLGLELVFSGMIYLILNKFRSIKNL